MDNLLFSLNATVPVFLVMILGYGLKKYGMLNDEFIKVANKFNYNITLPALLFIDLAKIDFKEVFDIKYVLYCSIVTIVCIGSICIFSAAILKDKSLIGEFIQSSYRGSAAVFGVAFIMNISGTTGMAPLMILGSVPIYNIMAVIVLTVFKENKEKLDIKKLSKDIIKNPILISIIAGLLFSLSGLRLFEIGNLTISNVAKLASPLALICVGGSFKGKKALAMIRTTLSSGIIKLIIQPAIFLPIAIILGFTGDKLLAVIIMLGSPTTPSAYIMARNLKHEGTLTSSAVVFTTILSAFTITTQIFIVKALGLL